MENILLNLLEVSLGASILILLMILAAPLTGKKFSAKWRYWVWLLLAVRLLLPFSMNILLYQANISIPVPQQLTVEQNFVPKAEEESGHLERVPVVPIQPESGIVIENQPIAPVIESKTYWTPSGLELLFIIWVIGIVISVIWQIVSYLRWRNESKVWNRIIEDENVLNLYHELCREQGVSKSPQLMQNKRIHSPMMTSLLNPIILLPQIEYSEEDYAVVLTHEINHYKRHDLWYKLLLLAARCVHWFNPLVWLMLREADNDLEITCDEAVVKNRSSDDRAFYCETILRIMCRGKGRYAVLSTGFNGGKKVLQRRFEAVLNDRASKGFVLGAVSMALLVFCSSFVSCDVKEPQEKPTNVPVMNEEVNSEEEELQNKYLAVPETQRNWALSLSEDLQPTEGQLDYRWEQGETFWAGIARSFLLAEFELYEDMPSKELGKFFNIVANTQHLYNNNAWGYKEYIVPYGDIICVLHSHLPKSAIKSFDPIEAFNENGETGGPYYDAVNAYRMDNQAPNYPNKATEVISSVKDGDVITIELADYDMDKYYADPQVKEIIETYRFSVRVAYDSWFLLEADITKVGEPEEKTKEKKEEVKQDSESTLTQTWVASTATYSSAPYKHPFRGLDVHATEQYETLNFYTTDKNAIDTILSSLNWQSKQPAAMKQELVTYDIDISGHFVRLITDNMEQLYIFKDHNQALYRDIQANCTYYDVDSNLYDRIFGLVEEIHNWKLNPVTDSRAEPFDENYSTLDIYAPGLQPKKYSLTIRTFCEMLIAQMDWEEIAVREENISEAMIDKLNPSDPYALRISTNTGRHLYIYKDYPYGVYYTGHGNEHYYKLSAYAYQKIYNLLDIYWAYRDFDAPFDVFPFQENFTNVTVSLQDKSVTYAEPEAITLNAQDSFRMMAGIPIGYFKKATPKEELSLDKGKYVLIENYDGQKLAIFNGKSQALHQTADGKLTYYEMGADYYDIAKAVARKVAGLSDTELEKYNVVLSKTSYKDEAEITTTKNLYDEHKEKIYTMISGLKKTAQPINPYTGVDGNITVKILDTNNGAAKFYTFMPGCDYVFADGSYVCPQGAYEMLNEYFD